MRKIVIFHLHFQSINHRVSELVRYFSSRSDIESIEVFYFFTNEKHKKEGLVIPCSEGIEQNVKINWFEVSTAELDSIARKKYMSFLKIERCIDFLLQASSPWYLLLRKDESLITYLCRLVILPLVLIPGLLIRLFNHFIQTYKLIIKTDVIFGSVVRTKLSHLNHDDWVIATNLWTLRLVSHVKKISKAFALYDPMEVAFDQWWSKNKWLLEIKRKIWKLFEGKHIKNMDLIVAVSDPMAKLYSEVYGLHPGQTISIPNAFYFKNYLIPSRRTDKIKFIIQTGFSHERGLLQIVESFARAKLTNATLSLRISGCPNRYFEKFQGYANIIIEKPISGEDNLISALVGFDVGIIPYLPDTSLNHKVCCPNKFFQYMNAGLAVMSTKTEYLSGVINSNNLGFLYDVYSVEQTIKQMEHICNPDSLNELRLKQANSLNFVKTEFNSAIWRKKLDPFFN